MCNNIEYGFKKIVKLLFFFYESIMKKSAIFRHLVDLYT